MVCSGITIGGHTYLPIIRNHPLTAQWYVYEIPRSHFVPFVVAIGDSFLLMHDNLGPPIDRLLENIHETKAIQRVKWSACSHDLNSTKHAWDTLGRHIAATIDCLKLPEIVLLEVWDRIPKSLIDKYGK